MVKLSIRGKIVLPIVVIFILLIAVFNIYYLSNISQRTNSLMRNRIEATAQSLKIYLKDCEDATVSTAAMAASDPAIVEAITRRDRAEIIRLLDATLELNSVCHYTVCDAEGVVLARTHAPTLFGDSIPDQPSIHDALSGKSGTHFEDGVVAKVSIQSGMPVYDAGGRLVGAISAGVRLDSFDVVDDLKNRFTAEFTIIYGKTKLATTIYNEGVRATDEVIHPDIIESVQRDKLAFFGPVELFGIHYSAFYLPLTDATGEVFAVIFAGTPDTELIQETNEIIVGGLLIGAGGLVFSTIALLLLVSRVIVGPIKRLTKLISKASEGEIIMENDDDLLAGDETVALRRDVRTMFDVVNTFLDDLSLLTYEYSVNGDFDYRIDTEKYKGIYRDLAEGINDYSRLIAEEILHLLHLVSEISHGNFDVEIQEMPGKKRILYTNFQLLSSSLRNLNVEIVDLARNISSGNLNVKAEVDKYQGDWAVLMETLNSLVKAVSEMNKAMNIVDQINTMICIADLDYNILYMNQSLRNAIGLKGEIDATKKCHMILRGSNDPCPNCYLKELLLRQDEFPSVDYSDCWNSDLKMWIGGRASIIRWVDGSLVFLNAMNDESAEKALMEQMREADERMLLMLDAMPLSCKLWDVNHNLIDCNLESVKLFDLSNKQEYVDRYLEFSPEYQPSGENSNEKRREMLDKAFREGYARTEWTHIKPDGSLFPTDLTLVRVKYKDNFIVAGYSQDLRELKTMLSEMHKVQDDLRLALDAAEAANKAKSTFLANMSHEIRTPMNSIIGFSELASDGDLSPKARGYFEKVLENAEWLLQIVNDILDISKIEYGKMELERIPFDLHDVLSHCQSMLQPKAAEKGLQMTLHTDLTIGRPLLGDPVRLRQVLINVLTNAVKFTERGTVKLNATVDDVSLERISISFSVEDSGIGMTPEQIEQVFKPFAQADNSVTRRFGGTGLGLSITKNIVEMMGGVLQVESTPNVGSKFFFELSFDILEQSADLQWKTASDARKEKPIFDGTVLVCEDNEMNQQVIREHLARVGLEVVLAHDGREGVQVVRERLEREDKPFDLIFMDIHMPNMDGREAAFRITEMGVNSPIIALTANVMSNDLKLYKASGMTGHLGKPFTSQELWRCLLEHLTPVEKQSVSQDSERAKEEALLDTLKTHFLKNNADTCTEIANAIRDKDIKLAHRLVHTLKSNAGQIGMSRLQQAAAEMELHLSGTGDEAGDGDNMLEDRRWRTLETEMEAVLLELSSLRVESLPVYIPPDENKIRDLIERVDSLVENHNPECMDLLPEIRAIPGSETLVKQIENFDFKEAALTIARIRKEMA